MAFRFRKIPCIDLGRCKSFISYSGEIRYTLRDPLVVRRKP